MYLSDRDIRAAIEIGNISITDFDESRLQPASYDIRLGDRFLIVRDDSVANIDPVKKILPEYEEVVANTRDGFILRP
jgi:dCTP deaminase